MTECPACNGDGGFDLIAMVAPIDALAETLGLGIVIDPWVECDCCMGVGTVTESEARDYEAWMRAKVDQAIAEYDDRMRINA